MQGVLALAGAALLDGCYVRRLPPPAAPPFSRPVNVRANPSAPPGTGRVIFDVTGQAVDVYRLVPTFADGRWTPELPGDEPINIGGVRHLARPACTPPCALDLPLGLPQRLLIVRDSLRDADQVTVVAREIPTVLRHTMGARPYRNNGLFWGGFALGVGSFTVSVLSLGFTMLRSLHEIGPGTGSSDHTSAWVLSAVSIALSPFGFALMLGAPRTVQPGASSLWSLDGTPLPR